ncbi:hypothetical protein DEMA109039_04435 [Deinococcus marmoris]
MRRPLDLNCSPRIKPKPCAVPIFMTSEPSIPFKSALIIDNPESGQGGSGIEGVIRLPIPPFRELFR